MALVAGFGSSAGTVLAQLQVGHASSFLHDPHSTAFQSESGRPGNTPFAGTKRRHAAHQKRPVAKALGPTFGQILDQAERHTLFGLLSGVPLPESISNGERERLFWLLRHYDPGFMTADPFTDVRGQPIALRYCASEIRAGTPDQQTAISEIFEAYPAHRSWLAEQAEVRTIQSGDVPDHECALAGRDGVFALRELAPGQVLALFDGMLIDNPDDIRLDRRLRQLAGCDNYHVEMSSDPLCLVEGMGLSMKFNTATLRNGSFDWDRINLESFWVPVMCPETGRRLNAMAFRTLRAIRAGEQLCYPYQI
jgi:hypothetical protein